MNGIAHASWQLLAWSSLLAWLAMALLRGAFWRVRALEPGPDPAQWPEVVAVVPARDEALLLPRTLPALLAQDYPGRWHVIVVDDHSSDGSAATAAAIAQRLGLSGRLTVAKAGPLAPGWAGKVWAQSEGLALLAARFPGARYVFFTDADVAHGLHALRRLVACAEGGQLSLRSLMVRLRCVSLAERALVPAFVFFFTMLYPFAWVRARDKRTAAAAGGCMLARLDALQATGGLQAIRGALIDDCALASSIKPHGGIRLDLADDSRSLRAYGWRTFWNMIARSAYTQLRHSRWRLAATVAGMLLLYLAPPLLLLAAGSLPAGAAWLLSMALYQPMLRYHGRSPLWASVLWLVALFYLGATLASAWRHARGRGGQWKGRSQACADPG